MIPSLICQKCGQPFDQSTGWPLFKDGPALVIENRADRDRYECRMCQMGGSMPPPDGLEESRNIEYTHEYLKGRWPALLNIYKQKTGKDLFITSSYRSPKVQHELWRQGRETFGVACWHNGFQRRLGNCTEHPLGLTVTRIDGIKMLSNHNFFPSRAIDVCVDTDPDVRKVVVSYKVDLYAPLVEICDSLGLISGGSWKNWKDWPHIEMPRGILQ